jgi:uncharacterized protein (TIGR03435 family)
MRGASVLVLTGAMFAAGQAPAKLEFEVATVKPAVLPTGPAPPRGGPGSSDPGYVHYTYMSVKNLLMTAYDMKITQITGPAWIDSERYDITASVPPGATKEQVNLMLQNLLADRFKLVVHRETKEMPLYELLIAKGGSKLKPYVVDPNPPKQPEPGRLLVFDKDGNPVLRPGTLMLSTGAGRRRIAGSKQSISKLTTTLAVEVQRPVIDKTGLEGEYDYALEFLPEGPNAYPPGQAPPPPSDADPPTILVAVQEQLGLKLDPKKGPVEMLVVDRGEKTPAEN